MYIYTSFGKTVVISIPEIIRLFILIEVVIKIFDNNGTESYLS